MITFITRGTTFSTPFEDGCIALETPGESGTFLALDSDGEVAEYATHMVTFTDPRWADVIARGLPVVTA